MGAMQKHHAFFSAAVLLWALPMLENAPAGAQALVSSRVHAGTAELAALTAGEYVVMNVYLRCNQPARLLASYGLKYNFDAASLAYVAANAGQMVGGSLSTNLQVGEVRFSYFTGTPTLANGLILQATFQIQPGASSPALTLAGFGATPLVDDQFAVIAELYDNDKFSSALAPCPLTSGVELWRRFD